jgi:hypothetical protein
MPDLKNKCFYLVLCCLSFNAQPLLANPLSQAIKTETATVSASIKSQQKINRVSDKTQQMLNRYRAALHQTKSLKTYNRYLQDMLQSQQQEMQSLQEQLENIDTTQQEIVPLILRMLQSLEQFVALDMPFLPEERQQRIQRLKVMVQRADVTNAEKYRRILEAFQIENDYGKTIEAYRGDLKINGKTRSVDYLRLGRVALYYQLLDGSETGFWNKEQKQWQQVNDYRSAVKKGLRIARKQMAPDLLTLPIPAAEAAR